MKLDLAEQLATGRAKTFTLARAKVRDAAVTKLENTTLQVRQQCVLKFHEATALLAERARLRMAAQEVLDALDAAYADGEPPISSEVVEPLREALK